MIYIVCPSMSAHVHDVEPFSNQSTRKARKYFRINHGDQKVYLICGHYKYVYFYSAGIGFRRQNLTSKVNPRAVRVKDLSLNISHHLQVETALKISASNECFVGKTIQHVKG